MTTRTTRKARSASLGFWLILTLAIWPLASASCSKTGGGDSESHFLQNCDKSGACAPGLSCLCGVCSKPCDDDLDCNPAGSSCRSPSEGECPGATPASLCDAGCSDDADCEALGDFVCRSGLCRERAGSSPTGGSGGTFGAGGTPTGGNPVTGGSPSGGVVGTGGSGGDPSTQTGGSSGSPTDGGAGAGNATGGDGAGGTAGAPGGELSNELCAQLPDTESCEARGCYPVHSSGRVFRVSPQAGSGGSGGGSDCLGSGGSNLFLGCTLGAGGAINLCYCDESDATRCVWAASEFRNIESSWALGDCGGCLD